MSVPAAGSGPDGSNGRVATPPPPVAPGLAAALELGALGAALTLVMSWLAQLPAWFQNLGTFQALYAAAFLFYALAVARLHRYEGLPHVGLAVFAVAAACRVLLIPLPPSLSGDLFRYVWEGGVWWHGGNPYAQAPADPALAALRDTRVFPFINHPHLSTIYPPLAEAGFALVASLSPTILAFKLWIVAHDLALVAVLLAWSARERGSAAWALIYAWNPLALVEYAGTGHNDPTAMLGLALAFFLGGRHPTLSAMALAWGALVKLAPLLAIPFLWPRWNRRARLVCLALLIPGLAWFAAQTREPYSGLVVYWGQWRNNELAFHLAERWLGSFGLARAASVALVGGIALGCVWRRVAGPTATRRVLGTALLTSPVVHPWYAGWILMFEIHGPSAPWLLLSALLPLSYGIFATPLEGRSFHAPLGVRWIEYGLPLLVALVLAWRGRRPRALADAAEERDVP
ncbi:MAG: glycosyltransferase family 87 protein [Candidatus Eisenbacteria bacterium]